MEGHVARGGGDDRGEGVYGFVMTEVSGGCAMMAMKGGMTVPGFIVVFRSCEHYYFHSESEYEDVHGTR